MDKDDLRAFIEIRDFLPGKIEREIQVQIPNDTVLIETYPKTVMVEVFNKEKKD